MKLPGTPQSFPDQLVHRVRYAAAQDAQLLGTIQVETLTVQGLALWQNAYARFVFGG